MSRPSGTATAAGHAPSCRNPSPLVIEQITLFGKPYGRCTECYALFTQTPDRATARPDPDAQGGQP